MTSDICNSIAAILFAAAILCSCSKNNSNKLTQADTQEIIKEVKRNHELLTEYSEKARLDSFLSCYDNTPLFLQFSSDGKRRNYEEFSTICAEYYKALKEQAITTTFEKFDVLDSNLVILSWTGDIIARLRNGDTMKMEQYSITSVYKKTEGRWKIIHSHESALPPEILKTAPGSADN